MTLTCESSVVGGYADLPRLMSLMTGDEKHSAAATSTLDVLWVLYDRVLDVTPSRSTTRGATGSSCPRATARWPTTPSWRPRGSSPPRGCSTGRRSTPRSATTRTGCWSREWRSPPGRSATDCRSPSERPWGCAPRASTARVVVLVGDAELDEGSNARGRRGGGRSRARPADRRRGGQPLGELPHPGADRASLRDRGLGRGRPSTDATTPRSRRRSTRRDARSPRGRGRGGGGQVRTPREQFAATARDLLDERCPGRAGLGGDLRPLLRGRVETASGPGRERRHPRAAAGQRRRRYGPDRDAPGRAHDLVVSRGAGLRAGEARLRPPGKRRRARRRRRVLRRGGRRTHASGAGGRRAPGHPSRRPRPCPRHRSRGRRGSPGGGRRGRAPLCPRGGAGQRRGPTRRTDVCTGCAAVPGRSWWPSARCSTRCSRPPPGSTWACSTPAGSAPSMSPVSVRPFP